MLVERTFAYTYFYNFIDSIHIRLTMTHDNGICIKSHFFITGQPRTEI
ncbi:hypothetical protein [Candidatus Odyssella thessalonicensis]|nr:hypothetical protein [Candidatus Odyssella thessalonicensis]